MNIGTIGFYVWDCPGLFILASRPKGFHKCLKFDIQSGANLNRQGSEGRTALMEAAFEKDHKSVQILINSGADVNCVSETGFTLLMWAACNQWHPGILCFKRLLREGAHVNKINKFGQNALQISVAWNATFCQKKEDHGDHYGKDVIMLLLAAGVSIEGTTVDRMNLGGHYLFTLDVAQYLQDFKKIKLSLKWACRNVMRKRLIHLDPDQVYNVDHFLCEFLYLYIL